MTLRTKLGIVFLVTGLAGLIVGSLRYQSREELFRLGSFSATTTHERSLPTLRYGGLSLMVLGVGLIVIRRRGSLRG